MAFIKDLTAIIDEALYKDHAGLRELLKAYSPEKRGSSLKVRGTFEEMEKLSKQLLTVKHHSSPATQDKAVDVSASVMAYMEQMYSRELSKIKGNTFVIETQPDLTSAHDKPNSTVQVTFRAQHGSTNPVRADFVRQRFITFYQRTASDLQVTSVPVGPHSHKDLQRRFPHLLFKPSRNKSEVTATGPFAQIAKLQEFITHSGKSPVKKGPAGSPSRRTPGPPPTHSNDAEDESCPICMEPMKATEKETLKCKHSFCKSCLKQAFDYKPVCPTCGVIYGTLTGTQPDGGTMSVTRNSSSLPGYERCGTIVIHYYIPRGIQKEEHPNPGQPYEGVSRTAYLPDSSEGRQIEKLLRQAFDQRLIFTVGRSTTTGRNNIVTWNDIHHKTSTHGGPTNYGYPDPDYLSRVRDELTVKGIK